MKKIIFSTMIALLLAFVGCQNEELVNETTDNGNGKKVTLTATIAGAANSRVVLNEVNEYDEKYGKDVPTIKVNWKVSDEKFTVYNAGYSGKADFKQDSGNEFTSKDALPDGKKTAYYGRYTLSNGTLSYNLSEQDGTLNEDCILMQAPVTDGSSKITFEHKTAILRVKFKGVNNQTVTEIVMDNVHTGSNNESITVTPTSLDYFYIFLPIGTDNYSGDTFNFTVTASGAEYTGSLTIPTGMSIEAGKLYTATIDLTPYLTFTVGGNQSQSLVLNVMGELDSSIEYSVNGGAWENFKMSDIIGEYGIPLTDPVLFTNNLRMRGKSASGTMDFTTFTGFMISFTENTPVTCSGDIRTLVDYTNYETTSTANACFYGLFMNCSALDKASELKLISNNDEMAVSCYESMFAYCENLTSAPERLPATTLAESCYKGMFSGCESLTSAPELPAEELASRCYVDMFNSCTSLESAPALPATTLAQSCYAGMFEGCSNLITAPALLPAPTLADNCYVNMFANCSNLTTAPALPATTLANYCYWGMFINCTNLNSVTMLATDIKADDCLKDWMSGVVTGGTFTKHKDMTSLPTGKNGIPEGWDVVDYEAQ